MKGPFSYLPSWVSKPTSSLSPSSIELLCFKHSYDDLFNHVLYLPCLHKTLIYWVLLWRPSLWKTFLSKEYSRCENFFKKLFVQLFVRCSLTKNKVCQFQLWFIFMHLYCDSCNCCKLSYILVSLLSSMSCVMVSVMLLVRILLLTLHSINLWPCLLSSVFAWGQAKV